MNSPEKPVYPEPLLSVIIPAHNAEKTLERAVESVAGAMRVIEGNETIRSKEKGFSEQNSTLSFLYEILIIENGSGDSTEFIAAGLQQKYQGRVRALHSERVYPTPAIRGLMKRGENGSFFLMRMIIISGMQGLYCGTICFSRGQI